MARISTRLRPIDLEVLRASSENVNIFTEFYFGVTLMPKQVIIAHAAQPNILELGGRGSGKTFGFQFPIVWYAVLIPDFRALWGSITADQATIPFEDLLQYIAENENFGRYLPRDPVKMPHPRITFQLPGYPPSRIDFKTIGRQATTKRGFTLDTVHFDEGGQEFDSNVIATLRPALRGIRVDGTRRLGRLSVGTTPTSAPWIERWWSRGTDEQDSEYDPDRYLCVRVRTDENIHLTEEEIELMKAEMTDEMQAVELGAELPYTGANIFPPGHIIQCENRALNDELDLLATGDPSQNIAPTPGAFKLFHRIWGMIRFDIPPVPGHVHLLVGDPGTGNPPYRGAGAVMVLDISAKPIKMVAFWWTSGFGKWTPWINAMKYYILKYRPKYKGIDNTGAQTLLTELEFQREGLNVKGFHLGTRKGKMIVSLQLALERAEFQWPFIKGLRDQLSGYREPDKNLRQDLVMCLATGAYMIDNIHEKDKQEGLGDKQRKDRRKRRTKRRSRRSGDVRSKAGRARAG